MDFTFTAEQQDLRATVRAFLGKHAAPVRAREPGSFDAPLWRRLTGELGLTALAVPQERGGFGGSLIEVAVVLEEAGRCLLALPYLSTVVASMLAPPDLQASIAAGQSVVALALDRAGPHHGGVVARGDGAGYLLDGVAEQVPDGDVADLAIVAAGWEGSPALFSVALDQVSRDNMSTLDQTRPVARLTFASTPAALVSATPNGGAAARALDLLQVARAVELIGTASASLAQTVAYLLTRRQFGVALATFQALRHRVADLAVQVEAATSTVWYAVRAPVAEQAVLAPMAKLVAADAAYAVTAESIQLHGGIGFTWEHDAHRYFKRATVGRLTGGDPVSLRRLVGERAGLART